MVQPVSSNSDNNELAKQAGVQQGLDNGSSNSGSMQGASAGGDANQINGNANQLTQIQNQHIIIIPNDKPDLDNLLIPPQPSDEKKASRFWRVHPLVAGSLVLIVVLGGTAFSVPKIRTVLGVDKYTRPCSGTTLAKILAWTQKKIVICVAEFSISASGLSVTSEDIVDELKQQLQRQSQVNVDVSFTKQKVSSIAEAEAIGQEMGADMVVWGHQHHPLLKFKVGLEVINQKFNHRTLAANKSSKTLSPVFETDDMPKLLSVLIHLALSQTYYFNNQISEAQKTLKVALNEIQDPELEKINAIELSKAYSFLGFLFMQNEYTCPKVSECKQAIDAYKEAFRINPKNYSSLWVAGLLYEKGLKDFSSALDIYNQIIDSKYSVVTDVLESRVSLYLKLFRSKEAIVDSKSLILQKPNSANGYSFLLQAQLQDGDLLEAENTAQKVVCHFNQEVKNSLIKDLNSLSEERSTQLSDKNRKDVAAIIEILQTSSVPTSKSCQASIESQSSNRVRGKVAWHTLL